MKKTYIAPSIKTATLGSNLLLPSASNESLGIRHGGIDNGTHAADSRRGGLWNDEEE